MLLWQHGLYAGQVSIPKMHTDEVPTSKSLVRQLLSTQFPEWAGLAIEPVLSSGTDNAIYRLGQDMAVRLPRIHWAVGQVKKEHEWLPKLAPYLPLALPVPLAMGEPGAGYPWHWSVYQWLSGENVEAKNIVDANRAATDIAHFILALQKINTVGAPLATNHGLRGASLKLRDQSMQAAIKKLAQMIDTKKANQIWQEALSAPEWEHEPVWFHGDMLPGNILFKNNRASAIIDFNGAGVGDPACDLMIAWNLFSGESRELFRATMAVDDATWLRGKGQALSQAVIFLPYYLHTNPLGVARAKHAIKEILSEKI